MKYFSIVVAYSTDDRTSFWHFLMFFSVLFNVTIDKNNPNIVICSEAMKKLSYLCYLIFFIEAISASVYKLEKVFIVMTAAQ